MVDKTKAAQLYAEAYIQALHTPAMSNKLAGNCVTVHFGMVAPARALLGPSVALVMGHVEIGQTIHFSFTDDEVASWRAGSARPLVYNLHAWLEVGTDLIDLTLASTLYEMGQHPLPSGLTYLDRKKANELGISYVRRLSGDHLPFDLNLWR